VKTGAAYLLVLVLTVELAVAEAFLTAARPWGHPAPVAALLAALANPVLGYAGGRVLRRTAGAVLPGVLWLLTITVLGAQRPEGDGIVPATTRGYALIAVGAVAAVVGVARSRTSPGAPTRR
jgi:hypothetical protein